VAGLANLRLTAVSFLFIFFNHRLEQRDLTTYQTDLHQIFMVGRHVAVDVQSCICFTISQGTLPWQPILGAKSGKIGDTPSFLGLTFQNGWQDGKGMDALTPLMSCLQRTKIW